jgi:hypothetical protein
MVFDVCGCSVSIARAEYPWVKPFIVQHFHGGRIVYPAGFNVLSTGPSNAITPGSFFYDLSELSANIWIMSPASGRHLGHQSISHVDHAC